MFSPPPICIPLPSEGHALDDAVDQLPREPAVFFLDVGEGQQPYVARTANLWRRMRRLLRAPEAHSRMLHLRGIARELRYWPSRNLLETSVLIWEQARLHHPARYRRLLRLRLPYYVALLNANRFPRAVLTRNPHHDEAAFGPFPTRTAAEDFVNQSLDLFQLRRCEEDLDPQPTHPGCIYGEMGMCLRPCQAAVDDSRYRSEARSFLSFLATRGDSLRDRLERDREAASEALDFEAAARLHKRLGRLDDCFTGNAFPRLLAHFDGVAVVAGNAGQHAQLWAVHRGHLQPAVSVPGTSLDTGLLRDLLAPSQQGSRTHSGEVRQELLALLLKWRHSSWCDGEWVELSEGHPLPTRRLRNAIRRVLASAAPGAAPSAGNHEEAHAESGDL